MSDSDPKMMRSQQDKDSRATIVADETQARAERTDSDAASGAARGAAKASKVTEANDQMDAIFQENKRFEEPAIDAVEEDMLADAATDGKASLVRPGRSTLND